MSVSGEKKYIKNFGCNKKKNNVILIIILCLTLAWSNLCVVTSARTRTEWPFETCPSMASSICPQWALSAPQTLCATTTPGSDFTPTKDGLKDEILPPPTCSLMRNVLFQPHHSGIVYTSELRGDGIPYSMANCKMQAPHRFRIPLQRRWGIKATFWTLYILWLYWAVDWLPVWLPPKASRMSTRM